ncbi:putative quinol monooxygenase [Asaia bogorensis]|uniref:putative quinol monooxygenase n=1 Tax=Asaia bogorensis TaxID=91915 RepID=UPI002859F28E|nr:putative quinol monooxygenase [Asaia bogorensis]MDR6183922.1 quinol monooxygenase YgiN [Asaia bogorensis NBRC 16594]
MPEKSCVSAIVTVADDHHSACRTLLRDIAVLAREDAGCLRFVVYEDRENRGRFAINEEWEDEVSLQHHLETDHVLKVFDEIGKLDGKIDNMWCAIVE